MSIDNEIDKHLARTDAEEQEHYAIAEKAAEIVAGEIREALTGKPDKLATRVNKVLEQEPEQWEFIAHALKHDHLPELLEQLHEYAEADLM